MTPSLETAQFPTPKHSLKACWAPILFSPISGSSERLVVGVAAVNADGFHLEMANMLEKLHCLYGNDALGAIQAVQLAETYIANDLSRRSLDAVLSPDPPVSGIFMGECREAEGLSLASLAQNWMAALSSLYSLTQNTEHQTHKMSQLAAAGFDGDSGGDRLPFLVCDYVKSLRTGFGEFFSADLREGRARRRKGGSHKVVIDFSGPKLVANFGTLRAGNLTASIHLIKRRLWDLKVERDKETGLDFTRSHEMILQRPTKDDPQITKLQHNNIVEALGDLEAQADQEKLRLIALPTVNEIGQRVLGYDMAA
jgi:hypothetical protein